MDHLLSTLTTEVLPYYALKQRRQDLGFEGINIEVKKRQVGAALEVAQPAVWPVLAQLCLVLGLVALDRFRAVYRGVWVPMALLSVDVLFCCATPSVFLGHA